MRSGNGIQNEASGSVGRVAPTARGFSYKEFLNCKPRNFNGTEGAVGLTKWFKKMKSVFRICSCAKNCQVKYVACTFLDGSLNWLNTYSKYVGIDAAYETSWEELKKMMTEEYC
uniref:Putative reverse transcriptase domain-containing protein n=1 Tax=Tanacetum cinerariifolium TaxID=118510 RepID=A0A6L2MH55_TANCI|nr:putative reverse transcriptase domain-containing protein [Tanacetum cinerariifolium]